MAEFDCQETKRHVHEYLHNELSEQGLGEITAHLANCDSCESDYDLENTINGVIEKHCSEVAPEQLVDSIMGRIRAIQAGDAH